MPTTIARFSPMVQTARFESSLTTRSRPTSLAPLVHDRSAQYLSGVVEGIAVAFPAPPATGPPPTPQPAADAPRVGVVQRFTRRWNGFFGAGAGEAPKDPVPDATAGPVEGLGRAGANRSSRGIFEHQLIQRDRTPWLGTPGRNAGECVAGRTPRLWTISLPSRVPRRRKVIRPSRNGHRQSPASQPRKVHRFRSEAANRTLSHHRRLGPLLKKRSCLRPYHWRGSQKARSSPRWGQPRLTHRFGRCPEDRRQRPSPKMAHHRLDLIPNLVAVCLPMRRPPRSDRPCLPLVLPGPLQIGRRAPSEQRHLGPAFSGGPWA